MLWSGKISSIVGIVGPTNYVGAVYQRIFVADSKGYAVLCSYGSGLKKKLILFNIGLL